MNQTSYFKTCPNCRNMQAPTTLICQSCGYRFGQSRKKLITIGSSIACVLALAAGFFYWKSTWIHGKWAKTTDPSISMLLRPDGTGLWLEDGETDTFTYRVDGDLFTMTSGMSYSVKVSVRPLELDFIADNGNRTRWNRQ